MDNRKILIITRTGVLLALTVVLQYVGRYIPLGPNSNFVVGPLVNACLLVATAAAGIWGGTLISVVAPLFAVLTTNTPAASFILVFSPFIAAGNFILVLMFHMFRKRSKWTGILTGAVLKFLILFSGVRLVFGFKDVPGKLQTVLKFMFGWPQIVTAVAGGIIAVIVITSIKVKMQLPPREGK